MTQKRVASGKSGRAPMCKMYSPMKVLLLAVAWNAGNIGVGGIQIDNQLVASPNESAPSPPPDCFVRIALGAMMPFENTFRNTDTNLLKNCEELCSSEGSKCQTFAFGIHVRGNGTCQLSSKKMFAAKSRPEGTIFDPDFDIYSRKENCLPSSNGQEPPFPGGLENSGPGQSSPSIPPTFPTSTGGDTSDPGTGTTGSDGQFTSTPNFPTTYHPSTHNRYPVTERYPPPTNVYDPYPSPHRPSYNGRPDDGRPTGYGPPSFSGTDGEGYYDKSPPPGNYPPVRRPPSPPPPHPAYGGSYDNYNNNNNNNKYGTTSGESYNQNNNNNYNNGNYPGPYDRNYPAPNYYPGPPSNKYPNQQPQTPSYTPAAGGSSSYSGGGGGGSDYSRPSGNWHVATDSLYHSKEKTDQNSYYNSRPDYPMPRPPPPTSYPQPQPQPAYRPRPESPQSGGSGGYYGNSQTSSSYGSQSYHNKYPDQRPSRPEQPSYGNSNSGESGYQGQQSPRPPNPLYPGQDNSYQSNKYPEQKPTRPAPPPSTVNPYQPGPDPNRPDPTPGDSSSYGKPTDPPQQGSYGPPPPTTTPRPTNKYPNQSPPSGYERPAPTGPTNNNYYVTEENQDKYKPQPPPSAYRPSPPESVDTGYGGKQPKQPPSPPRPGPGGNSCFRRVLAGKRVAPQWVRKTLSCERLEDCQRECSDERRFICEGFNYRLDPTGRGQGNCELIDIPLSEIDLYSSAHSRDANLLNHPDYDYFERDRNNSPSCRVPSPCTDCGSRTQPPAPPSIDYYRPPQQNYGPPPNNYGPPPPPPPSYQPSMPEIGASNSYSSSGYSSGGWLQNRFDRYDNTAVDYYRPHPVHNYEYRPAPPPPAIDRYDYAPRPGSGPPVGNYEVDLRPDHRPPPPQEPSDFYRPNPPRPSYPVDNYNRYPKPGGDQGGYSPKQPVSNYIPYLIGQSYGSYGSSSSSEQHNKYSVDYWGLRGGDHRKEGTNFNYYELGAGTKYHNVPAENSVWSYPGSRYGGHEGGQSQDNRFNHSMQWTRRPGPEDCSVKSSEGFRLHKGVVRFSLSVPTVTECERMCSSMDNFKCFTYSYRYSGPGQNCLLCDRPYNTLDYYADIEPDRNYDIYSMTDDLQVCHDQPKDGRQNEAQCFFKAIDSTRFFKSIVRDSLTTRSIGECELECIKSQKFTCRAFTFRLGMSARGDVIDNCQLSDWPVRDMDKKRHLVPDQTFDIYERASYGHGCELQPINDPKHQKLCYLGYGTSAKLLTAAIKKVASVPTELDCKNECVRLRDNTPFKCFSFSYGSQASSFNCEMSDLDQSELKENIHYSHTTDRDYWLFAWNPFDSTCRDKVTSQGGNRVDNGRRMDIFRETGSGGQWRHFTVAGLPCRSDSKCEKNLVTGFFSCEMDGGEIGAWDYCCRDDHPCGYSQGFEYPWCFVGEQPDQWRNCSDRYFPVSTFSQGGGGGGSPSVAATTTITSSINPSASSPNKKYTIGKPFKNRKGQIYQSPPRPGLGSKEGVDNFSAARLWPITYLYNDGPPNANSTELSNFVDCKKEGDC